MQKNCSVLILAAGLSSRMGSPKFALKTLDGASFLDNIIKQYLLFGCEEIVVVVNNEGNAFLNSNDLEYTKGIRIVINHHPEYERFYSIHYGLSSMRKRNYVFIHNVDNPFVNESVMENLYLSREEADWLKPTYSNRGGHPILISEKIVREIVSSKNYKQHLSGFLAKYSFKAIEVSDEKILTNINTEKDYKSYFNIVTK